ncbi:MAG TPA: HD domain-containing protein, partial [Solirubrobacteraceae bacterium]|nr:HD domain-containing protein [Solirubrobacteraceae bacterium]
HAARPAARAIARAAGRAACFALSEEFGAWRVSARDSSWQVDVEPLRGGSLQADLALRDFTVNAIAEPLGGGAPIDPTGGIADLSAKRLRMVAASAFAEDPLRVLRLGRVAVELGLDVEPDTLRHASEHADGLARCSPERVFVELRRIIGSREALRGLELLSWLGATAVVLPELEALRGVEQNRFHHADVYDHTIEVLARTIALERFAAEPTRVDDELATAIGDRRADVAALLAEPLADGLTRGEALRWGALMHDAAKPLTRGERPDGRVTFVGHDERGASLARDVLGRLRTSERLRAHVAALARHHLRLGFLVHEPQPLARRTVFAYLHATEPVELDVTLLSVADRLATRGDRAQQAIAAHLEVARAMLVDALHWRATGPEQPLVRGDELGSQLGIAPGPLIGTLLGELAAAQYAGEIATREQAFAHAEACARDARGRSE